MKASETSMKMVVLSLGMALIITTATQARCARVSKDVTFFFGIETPIPDPNRPITIDRFHTDLEVSFRATGWDVVVSYDGPEYGGTGLDVPPEEALLYGSASSRWVLSSIPANFEFIGAQANEPFWILPQNAISEALPLGIAAERTDNASLCPWNPADPRGADTLDRWIQLQLLDVRGPADGHFALWQADGINPPVVFMSTYDAGITDADVYYISASSHVHVNWGFTQAGLYEVDFRISTVVQCGEWLTADWAPPGNEFFGGDCVVDFQDFALLSSQWLQTAGEDDANAWTFLDPNDPVGTRDLAALSDQWLACGYPGCQTGDSAIDPNDENKTLTTPSR